MGNWNTTAVAQSCTHASVYPPTQIYLEIGAQ